MDRTSPGADTGADAATIAYGAHPEQVGDLRVPSGDAPTEGWPVVVLIHGGFWRERYRRDLMTPLAEDLSSRGWASWNVEYRRVGGDGGWPTTLSDVAEAIDHLVVLADERSIDPTRCAVVGHSAGGQLALWAAGRTRLPPGAPGADPRVEPVFAVGQAPVADLLGAVGLGDGAVLDLLGGGPTEVPERYRVADPAQLVGHGIPILLTHPDEDESVPPAQSERYARAAREAGDEVSIVTGPGEHAAVVDPADPLWTAVLDALERLRTAG